MGKERDEVELLWEREDVAGALDLARRRWRRWRR